MKKIIIEKEEGIGEVVDRMLEESDEELVLVVPKGSVLGRSVSNFHLLKREADNAGKSITVESVDETILAFAKGSDLEGSHPLWRGVHAPAGGVSDIVSVGVGSENPAPKRRGKKKAEPVKLTVREEPEEEIVAELEEEDKEVEEKEDKFFGAGRFFKKTTVAIRDYAEVEEDGDEEPASGRRVPRKLIWIGIGVVAVILLAVWATTNFLGRAAITINFKKTPWSYQGVFAADKSVSKANAAGGVIPAQVFTSQKNATQVFPASGSANVSIKAHGTLTIYNAYSSAAQQLVATTRFVTPDGKTFRLVNAANVPGAKITDGQIVPSYIDVDVVADQAGPAYNLGPVAKLTIPGFQGSPKYNAFYGAIKGSTAGGFVGRRAVPTAADITSAKTKTASALRASLTSNLTTSYPNNFKILDGATIVVMTKLTVSSSTDDGGNFSVFGEATLQAIGFDESAFKSLLLSLAQSQEQNSVFSDLTLKYGSVKPDFTRGKLNFSLSADGTLEPAFSADDFKGGITGKSLGAVRDTIAALPQLSDGKLSVWPMWLWNMPSDPRKIDITSN